MVPARPRSRLRPSSLERYRGIIGSLAELFGVGISVYLLIPGAIFELGLALYLIVMGFRPEAYARGLAHTGRRKFTLSRLAGGR